MTKKSQNSAKQSTASSLRVSKKPDLRAQLSYARDGHAVLRDFLPPSTLDNLRPILERHCRKKELEAWRQKVEVAADDNGSDQNKQESAKMIAANCQTVRDCKDQLQRLLRNDQQEIALPFLQYFNTWRIYPQVKSVVNALAESASILLDVPTVRLYQDAVFWKRANQDGPTPWHTDARMAPLDTSHMITFWMALQRVENSGLIFCSKSHADFALPFWNDSDDDIDDKDSPWFRLDERYGDHALVDYMPLAMGDVTVHSGWTLHCADSSENEDRLALAVTFVDARAPVREDALTTAKGDREDAWSYQDWVPQVPSNTMEWDHPLVPILWPSAREKKK